MIITLKETTSQRIHRYYSPMVANANSLIYRNFTYYFLVFYDENFSARFTIHTKCNGRQIMRLANDFMQGKYIQEKLKMTSL